MKYLRLLIVLFTIMINCVSCRTPSPTVITVERERVVQVTDSASFYALLECDSNNQAIIKSYSLQSTPNIKQDFVFDSGRIDLKMTNIRDSIIYNYRDSIIFAPIQNPNYKSTQNNLTTFLLSVFFLIICIRYFKKKSV